MTRSTHRSLRIVICLTVLASVLAGSVPIPSEAAPPQWAPAHGWRKKADPYYRGYHGRKWPSDYGILSGRCNRSAIGAVVGGAAGGLIGASVANEDARVAAIIVGSIIGGLVGREIGRSLDAQDRSCIGHSLELAKTGQTVHWRNPETGVGYTLTPTRDFYHREHSCRAFTTRATFDGMETSVERSACRTGDGTWRLL